MTANVSGSAKIYNFPARGRFAAAYDHDDNNLAANFKSRNFKSPLVMQTVLGSAWYHDEAVQESIQAADPRRKN